MIDIVAGGFAAGTLVKTPSGYTKIEDLHEQDLLVCYDLKNNKQKDCSILSVRKKLVANPISIELSSQTIITTPSQKFYFAEVNQWLDVFAIKNYKLFYRDASRLIGNIYGFDDVIECYEISVAECHNFYITTKDILVHNALPVIVAFFGMSIPTIMSSIVTLGGALGVLGVSFLHRKKTHTDSSDQKQNLNQYNSPDQDPDDLNGAGFFERLKKRADKKARTKRFGNLYRDPETKLWWSKDRAGHGGSAYKVFKEGSKGLEWLFDADMLGNPIVGKYKGPIGVMLPYKDLIVCH
jgi:hypothetical protein